MTLKICLTIIVRTGRRGGTRRRDVVENYHLKSARQSKDILLIEPFFGDTGGRDSETSGVCTSTVAKTIHKLEL
jgi:hypothetical protein